MWTWSDPIRLSTASMLLSVVSFFERVSRPRVFAHRGGGALGPENTTGPFEGGGGAPRVNSMSTFLGTGSWSCATMRLSTGQQTHPEPLIVVPRPSSLGSMPDTDGSMPPGTIHFAGAGGALRRFA